MRTSFLSLVFCCLTWLSHATDCPSHAQLYADLQAIEVPEYNDTVAIRQQQRQLRRWLGRWQQCYALSVADSSYVVALNKLAYAHLLSREFPLAIRLLQRAIAFYQKPNLRLKVSDLAMSYYRLGIGLYHTDQTEKSIEALLKTTNIAQQQPEAKPWAAAAYPYVLYYYFTKGDFEKALLHAEQGEKIARALGDEISISQLLQQKSQALAGLGRLLEAKQALEPAIALIRKYPKQHQSYASQERQLGVVLQEMGRPQESLAHYLLAYELAKKDGHDNLSDFVNSLGQHYYAVGNYTQALAYYQKALRIHKSQHSRGILLDNMGLVQRQLHNYLPALSFHQQGFIELSATFSDTSITALPPARTIQTIVQKEYLLIIVQDKADTWLAYARYSHNDKRKLENARRTYMLADSMIDLMRREHTQERSKLFWRSKARTMYERAIETCHLLNDPTSALHFFEKSRAVLLNDQLNERIAEQALTEKDRDGIQRSRRELHDLEKQWKEPVFSDKSIARLGLQRLEAQERYDKLVAVLEKNNPAYRQFRNDNHVPSLGAIRQNLRPENGHGPSAFLSYFVGDSAIYGICIDDKRFIFKELNRAEYQRNIGKFKESLGSRAAQNSQWKDYQQAAYRLYRTLVQPFGLQEGTRLIVSPDGDFIPFAALKFSPAKPDYLVQHHAISYTYSGGFLERVPRAAAGWWPSLRTFLGMAPVDFAPALRQSRLRGSDSTLQEIGSRFLFAKKLVGEAASRNAFAALAPRYRIVQLFTHAAADGSGVAPKLYFADSVFRLSDLPDTTFRTQLMVLAACQTGIGQNQRGEGVFSLARGFAAVGIPSTLTTLWSVEDQPTYGLTSLFYPYLADNLPLDEALQQAQIEWLKSDNPADLMPYAWAGVVLVGQRAPLGRYHGPWVYGLGVALLLFSVGLIFWGKKKK